MVVAGWAVRERGSVLKSTRWRRCHDGPAPPADGSDGGGGDYYYYYYYYYRYYYY